MLNKIGRCLLGLNLLSLGTYCIAHALERFVHSYRYDFSSNETVFSYLLHGLIFFLSVLLLSRIFRREETSFEKRASKELSKRYKCFALLHSIALLYSCGILLWASSINLFCTWQFMLKPLSCVADFCGNYRLAEQFYFLDAERIRSRKTYSSWGPYNVKSESAKEREARTAAVAEVYGKNSLEMANRVLFVGMNINQAKDFPTERALPWLYHALALFKINHAANGQVKAISEIAYCLYDLGELENVRPLLKESHSLLPFCSFDRQMWRLTLLSYFSKELKLTSYERDFDSCFRRIEKVEKSDFSQGYFFLLLIATSIVISSGLPECIVRRKLFHEIRRELLIVIATSNDRLDSVFVLSKAIDIQLSLGKLAEASALCVCA